jgi:hypothetical protein
LRITLFTGVGHCSWSRSLSSVEESAAMPEQCAASAATARASGRCRH